MKFRALLLYLSISCLLLGTSQAVLHSDDLRFLQDLFSSTSGYSPDDWNAANVTNACAWSWSALYGILCNTEDPQRITGLKYNRDADGVVPEKVVGTIPASIANLTKLTHFSMSANDLGILPLALFTLPEISTIVCVRCNDFGMAGGPVPTTFSPTLKYLSLPYCNLTGMFPSQLQSLPVLEHVNLGFNNLIGSLPNTMPDTLTFFNVAQNYFTGQVPATLSSLPNLESMFISDNRLSGPLPASFSAKLGILWANNNGFNGTIPTAYNRFWAVIMLYGNELTCPIDLDTLAAIRSAGIWHSIRYNRMDVDDNGALCGNVPLPTALYVQGGDHNNNKIVPHNEPFSVTIPQFDYTFDTPAIRIGAVGRYIYIQFRKSAKADYGTKEFVVWKLQYLEGYTEYTVFKRWSALVQNDATTHTISGEFFNGIKVDWIFLTDPLDYSIKVGFRFYDAPAPTVGDGNNIYFTITQYIRADFGTTAPVCVANRLGENIFDIPPGGAIVRQCLGQLANYTNVAESSDGQLMVNWVYETQSFRSLFSWNNFATSDGTQIIMSTESTNTYLNEHSLEDGRSGFDLDPSDQQYMSTVMRYRIFKFSREFFYDPRISLLDVFEVDPPEESSMGWVGAVVAVGVVAIALLVVCLVPKLRRRIFPFMRRSHDQVDSRTFTRTTNIDAESHWTRGQRPE